MRVVVVTPPAPVVSWQEADHHLRLYGDEDQKTYVEALIAAATAHIDGPEGWLGRCIGVQTLEARLDNFDCGSIRLPYPPVIDVVSVGYVDAAGVVQTVDPAGYELAGALVPVFDAAWPTPRLQREAVRIRYRAGYETTPAPIKAAILLMVQDLFSNRGSVVASSNATAVPMSTTVEALLQPYRVYR
jgi:uncharacterized phiE125 gp8 family phage protein